MIPFANLPDVLYPVAVIVKFGRESAMLDIMYSVPFMDGIETCVINEDVINKGADPVLKFAQEKQSA